MPEKEEKVQKKSINTCSGIGLFLITVLGTSLRMYRLGYQSLWHDEVLTYLSSNGTLAHVLFQTEVKTNILPLYYLIVHAFLYFGEEDVILRLPSLIFGALSIPLFFLVVRETLGTTTGILASFLLAISPFHIFYSQEARPYALLLFLCLLTFFLLQQCIKKQGESGWLKAAFVVVAASTFYCHTAAIAFLAFLGLYVSIRIPRTQWRNWVSTSLALVMLILPALYRVMMIQVEGGQERSFELSYLPYVIWAFSIGFSLGPTVLELHLADKMSYVIEYLSLILPILLYVSGLGLFGAKKLLQENRTDFVTLSIFFLLPLMVLAMAAIVTSRPFNVRHSIPSLLPFLMFIAYGIHRFTQKPLQIIAMGVFVAISVFSLTNYYFDERYQRENNREAGKYLVTHGENNALVICIAPTGRKELRHYTIGEKNFDFFSFPPKENGIVFSRLRKDLHNIVGERDHFWVFYNRSFSSDPDGHFRSYLEKNFLSGPSFHSTGIDLIRYTHSH